MGFGELGETFDTVGVAGDWECDGWDGRHEGRSQHKTVSSRSWDSGVEHPEKRKRANISAKWDEE